MANNQYNNKVILGSETLMDISDTTATASDVAYGKKFYSVSGQPVTGTNTNDADTSDANATAAEILNTKTAYVNGNKITGSMPNRGAVSGTISTKDGQYTIQQGYHDGSGVVGISTTEKNKLIPGNLKSGVTVLGVQGDYSGEAVTATSKTVTPSLSQQTVLPGTGYDYLSQVTVLAIPVTRTDNAQGGVTVSIAGA